MKKCILFTLLFVFTCSFSIFSQVPEYSSSRLDNYAAQLKRKTVDLADRTSDDLRRGNSNTRSDLDNAFLAAQLDASAGLFQQMIQDNRRSGELRDAAAILSDLSRKAPTYGSTNYLWRDIQNSVNDINRELGGNSGGGNNGGGYNPPERPVIGRAYWRGTVDNIVQLKLRDRNMETVTIAGTPYGEGAFSFTAALPRTRSGVTVDVIKKKGRGNARVIQQPSNQNDFTAIVEVKDGDGGAKEYELEILWRSN